MQLTKEEIEILILAIEYALNECDDSELESFHKLSKKLTEETSKL